MLATTALVSVLLASTPGMAEDSVQQVAMGLSPTGQQVRLVVWTCSGPTPPEGVDLQLAPTGDAPALSEGTAHLDTAKATQQRWTVDELRFDRDARGQIYTLQVGLWDADARLVDNLTVQVGTGGLVAGPDGAWRSGGYAHGLVTLDETGTRGSLELVLGGIEAARVAAVSLDVLAEPGQARPQGGHHAAALDQVQQLWVATLDLPAQAGDRYQVDGVVLDGQGGAYGTSFVSRLPVAPHLPGMAPPSAWTTPTAQQVASR